MDQGGPFCGLGANRRLETRTACFIKHVFRRQLCVIIAKAVKMEGSQLFETLKEEITDSGMLGWHDSCITAIQGRRMVFITSDRLLGSGPPCRPSRS